MDIFIWSDWKTPRWTGLGNIVNSFMAWVVEVIEKSWLVLLEVIEKIHMMDRPTPDIEEIPESFDPRKGHAYYFTESGNQLRKRMTYYDIPGTANMHLRCDAKCWPTVYEKFPWNFLWWIWLPFPLVLPHAWTLIRPWDLQMVDQTETKMVGDRK